MSNTAFNVRYNRITLCYL